MCKVRKILITTGNLTYDRSRKITAALAEGLSIKEVAKNLGISISSTCSFSPYSTGEYRADSSTKNALSIRKCRQNKKLSKKWKDVSYD